MKSNNSISLPKRGFIHRIWLLGFLFLCCSAGVFAQLNVKGKVVDEKGESLIGVGVRVKGGKAGTMTNAAGEFNFSSLPANAVLEFTYIGYLPQSLSVQGRNFISVTLQEDQKVLDEVVVVGYGTQKKTSVTGAVSTLLDTELIKAPVVGVTNVLGARVAGLTMLQQSGQPGADAASLLIRGESATYIVDGVIRSINEIDPNEIESISVLKDATSASVFGLNATSVVIVTTKRGKSGQLGITYRGSYGVSENANQLKWLDGPSYAYWYNKSRELDGDAPVFTEEQVEKMKLGIDGWGNTNWYDKVFGIGSTMNHNITATGGNEKVKFFSSLGTFVQKGNVENFNYRRYSLRTNVDAQLTDNLSLTVNVAGRIDEHDRAAYSANPNDWHNIPQQAVRALPYIPEKIQAADGKWYYTSTPTASSSVSPMASIYESGYSKPQNTTIQTNFSLKYDVPFVEGLSLKFMGSYDRFFQLIKSLMYRNKTMLAKLPTSTTSSISYTLLENNSGNTSLTESSHVSTDVVTQSSFTYDKAFGKHKLDVLGLLETRNKFGNVFGLTGYGLEFRELDIMGKITHKSGKGTEKVPNTSGNEHQARLLGMVGRINYDYDNRYLVEASIRRDGSYLFKGKDGERWINLPAVSLGWRMNNEDWFHATWVDNLKLRGGIGKTATSHVSPFHFLNLMGVSSNALILGDQRQSIMYTSVLGNTKLGWEQAITYNLGVDFLAWKGLLGVELDAFYKYQYDLVTNVGSSYPPSMGGYFFNSANLNKIDYRGFDFTISHNNRINDFRYGVKWVGTVAFRRWLYYAGDSPNTPDYLRLTGKEVGAPLGFIAEGLFQSEDEIKNSPTIPGKPVLPGYIKYKDRNGDGKITEAQDGGYDVAKTPYARFQTSLNLSANWKGIDFDMLWLAGIGRTVSMTGVYTSAGSEGVQDNTAFTLPFYHGGNSPQYVLEKSWRPDNPNAELPRLSLVKVSSNNAYSSTFWYRNGDYLRLKSCQLGYTLPQRITRLAGIDKVRVYVEGSNLLTFSELIKYNIDPEQPGVNNGYYPQQRTASIGLNLSL